MLFGKDLHLLHWVQSGNQHAVLAEHTAGFGMSWGESTGFFCVVWLCVMLQQIPLACAASVCSGTRLLTSLQLAAAYRTLELTLLGCFFSCATKKHAAPLLLTPGCGCCRLFCFAAVFCVQVCRLHWHKLLYQGKVLGKGGQQQQQLELVPGTASSQQQTSSRAATMHDTDDAADQQPRISTQVHVIITLLCNVTHTCRWAGSLSGPSRRTMRCRCS